MSIAAQTLPGQGMGGYPSSLSSPYGTGEQRHQDASTTQLHVPLIFAFSLLLPLRVFTQQRPVRFVWVWGIWSGISFKLAAAATASEHAAVGTRAHWVSVLLDTNTHTHTHVIVALCDAPLP